MTERSGDGALGELIHALRCLPGVGPKSAQRMAYHLLQRDREGAGKLADRLLGALQKIGHCEDCRTLTEGPRCEVCRNERRNQSQLCIVESAPEMSAILRATGYQGLFFVLNGRLSPLDGIGPAELGLDRLEERLKSGRVDELILATSTTLEGEATAYYVQSLAQQQGVTSSRLAYGMPLGGELELVDGATLSHAFNGRRILGGDGL